MTKEEKLSQRVRREKEDVLAASPQVDIERVKFLLETYKETEGEPVILRRAKFFNKLCTRKTIFIDNNPFAGTATQYKYGSYPFPEFGCRWMKKVKEVYLQRGVAPVTPEVSEWLNKAVDYWKDNNIYNQTQRIIAETRNVDIGLLQKCGFGTELCPGGFVGTLPDYPTVLTKGLNGIVSDVRNEISRLDIGLKEDFDKLHFYKASLLCLEGMISLAQRYAALAEDMAQREPNPERKRQLEKIAQSCRWVPANPPRSFYEALQATWFTELGIWLESPQVLTGPLGRFAEYLYPFYKKDKEADKITEDEAVELLQFHFLKVMGLAQILPPHGAGFSSTRIGIQLGIGGLTAEGEDATTELDYLVLEAMEQLKTPEPLIYLHYHDKLPDELLLKCVDLIRTGIGMPAFINAQRTVERHLLHHKEMTLEEARYGGAFGCVQSIMPGYMDCYWEGVFNCAKMVELTLNNGKDPLTGVQIGPQTGDPETFSGYDQFVKALEKQMEYSIRLMRDIGRVAWNVERDFPVPYASSVMNDCIKKGKDVIEGGARYSVCSGVTFGGAIDSANSLAAIKKLVYEDKKITIKQLKDALASDFSGYEQIQRMCLDAPKYGNDDPYVDSITKNIYETCYREHQKFPDYLGRPTMVQAYSVTAHVAMGRFTGALPSGRKARMFLTDASVSATPGTDKNGPTALIRSAAKVIDTIKFGSNHLNMKFHPSTLSGREGARKFLQLIKTYMDLGGYHVQFNCVSSETLRDAQQHPEKYRNLIVRVAGFSAYFIHLDPMLQDELIKRSELKFN